MTWTLSGVICRVCKWNVSFSTVKMKKFSSRFTYNLSSFFGKMTSIEPHTSMRSDEKPELKKIEKLLPLRSRASRLLKVEG